MYSALSSNEGIRAQTLSRLSHLREQQSACFTTIGCCEEHQAVLPHLESPRGEQERYV